jgi:hypothetical protein
VTKYLKEGIWSLKKKVCHTKCVTLLALHISLGIFSEKRYFNDILWAQSYFNNMLLLAAIRYKKTRSAAIER